MTEQAKEEPKTQEQINQSLMETLTKMNEKLESLSKPVEKEEHVPTPEELIAEFEKMNPQSKGKEVNAETLDQLSNTQLVELIMENVNSKVAGPIMERLEYLRVQAEIKEVKSAHPDFDEHKKEIFNIAIKNTNMSLEDAYFQVVGKQAKKAKDDPKEPEPKPKIGDNEDLRRKVVHGEKPHVASASVKPGESKTLKEAATRAVEAAFASK